MNQTTALLPDSTTDPWERAMYAFLAEKQRRSGSNRTVQGYSGMLRHLFGSTGKTPERVTSPDVFAWVQHRPVRPSAILHDHRRSYCLPEFLLPLPDPYGPGPQQPVRPVRAPEGEAEHAARPLGRRGLAAPGNHL